MKVEMGTYIKVFVGVMAVVTFTVAMAQAFVSEDEGLPISVEPKRLAVEVGMVGQFVCAGVGNYTSAILWLNADGTPVATIGENVVTDNNGTLNILNATLEDSADFTCVTTDRLYRLTVTLKVFVMPSYFQESIIIIAVNGALLFIFFFCMTTAKCKEHKQRKKAKQMVSTNTYP